MRGSRSQPDGPRRRATYADVLAAPEHVIAEIVDGELYTSPRPGPRHWMPARDSAGLSAAPSIAGAAAPAAGASELHVGEDIVVPDLAG